MLRSSSVANRDCLVESTVALYSSSRLTRNKTTMPFSASVSTDTPPPRTRSVSPVSPSPLLANPANAPLDRRKVLRHHPDKKASGSSGTNDDNFFKCIQKAFETLLNPETRRQFDSVDPAIEDYVPNAKTISAEEYCNVFGPIFAREARFSKKQPVPSFGTMDASKHEVESFYDFWYNFDSWRSFEALDKEVNEGSDS